MFFAGYGITAPEYGYDDYAGLDVKGKIVLVLRYEPVDEDNPGYFEGERHSRHAYFITKAKNAVAHGALGLLLFTGPSHYTIDEDLRPRPAYTFTNAQKPASRRADDHVADGFVAFHISRSTASAILQDVDLSKLQAEVDSGEPITEIVGVDSGLPELRGNWARMIQAKSSSGSVVDARNVAAFLPGTGDEDEDWIVVGAHHDHIGSFAGSGDTIYNGADDNASGVAGVLELAEQFAQAAPRRSMVFITFSAEEIGLFGSYALDAYDLIDLDRVGFMLNLDMLGRNPDTPVEIYGDGLAEGLTDLVKTANQEHQVRLAFQRKRYEPFSDIAVFHDNRIPFLMFFTGEHPDYHGTADHADKLHYFRMEKILRLSYDILDLAAGAERLPNFIS